MHAINVVVDILALQFQQFPLINIMKDSHAGHFPVAIFQLKYRISVFLVAEHDMLHVTGYFLQTANPSLVYMIPLRHFAPHHPTPAIGLAYWHRSHGFINQTKDSHAKKEAVLQTLPFTTSAHVW